MTGGPAPRNMSFPAGMRALHWMTAAVLVGSYVSTWAISGATSSATVAWLAALHRTFGVAILALTAARLLWRQRTRAPDLPPDMPRPQRYAARANVAALYVSLVLQPLLGLTASMLHGDRIALLGGIVLPGVLPVDRTLAHQVFGLHGTVALVLLGLIGMHAAAALYHHFVRRDDVLAGMLPGLPRRD